MTKPKQLPKCSRPELRLVIWPDEGLKHPAHPFTEANLGTRLVRDTAGSMVRALYTHYGVGLAAQQVGIPFQIFVMDSTWINEGVKRPKVFLNPQIVSVGDGAQSLAPPGEGCLSFPYNYRSPVTRHDKVELEWLDFKGEIHHQGFEGYEAIIIQHEIDHLMGHCFIDRLSKVKRDMAIRKARKIRRKYKKGFQAGINKLKQVQHSKEYLLKRQKTFEQLKKAK